MLTLHDFRLVVGFKTATDMIEELHFQAQFCRVLIASMAWITVICCLASVV